MILTQDQLVAFREYALNPLTYKATCEAEDPTQPANVAALLDLIVKLKADRDALAARVEELEARLAEAHSIALYLKQLWS